CLTCSGIRYSSKVTGSTKEQMNEQLNLFRPDAETPSPRERHVQLGPRIVGYTLRQGRNRRLTLTIDERGLRVGAPRQIRIADVEEFLRTHGDWVVEKLDGYAVAHAPRQLAIRAGVKIPFLDDEVTIEVMPGGNRVRWFGNTLFLEAPPDT